MVSDTDMVSASAVLSLSGCCSILFQYERE
jgi:hypothetical protein